jgi:O-antigen/teichoic acid export membrane protein
LALTDSEPVRTWLRPWLTLAGRRLWARVTVRLGDSDLMLVQRLAGTVFLIRVASALLAYGSQVLFARWMGGFEFGIYVYVWTWVLLIGQALDLGLATAAQRFIPEYREQKRFDHLRGYLFGSRFVAVGVAILVAAFCAGLVRQLQPWLDDYTVIPLYLACAALPAYALSNVQDGISRSYDWVALGIVPTYIVRQLLLTAFMAAAYLAGLPLDAITAMVLAGLALWLPPLGQLMILKRRLAAQIEAGPRSYDFRLWISTALPILLAEGFYLLLAHTDVLMLQQFRPPDEVAVYYAAAKTLAFVSFIGFSIAATTAHRCAGYQAAGDTQGLHDFLAKVIRFTFWPSLAVTLLLLAFGRPLLSLFGPGFGDGHHLMFIMAVGLVARAAIGPMERFLNMLGQQRACALVYASAFGINVALCLLLIPHFGATGAAVAIATALIVETLSLALVARHKLGFNVFIWGRGNSTF